ncbi:MAG: hypothetical protein RR942_18350 [Romboutsia sp.]
MLSNHITEIVLDWGYQLVLALDKFSFKTCLLVGLVALILSIFGFDKGKKIAIISPAIYVILQIFLEVWFGV